MSQRYDPQSGDPEDAERARLEQEEMLRQLTPSDDADSFDPSKFTAGMSRRGGNGGAFGGALSGAGAGSTIGSVVPGIGSAIGAGVGALVGGIGGLVNKKAKSAATDYAVDDARQAVSNAYTEFNGRAPEGDEVDSAIRGQGWKPGDRFVGSSGLESVIGNLRSNAATAKAQAPAAESAVPAAATAAAAPTAASGGYGKAPAGYDQKKWDDPNSDSAKYIMGRGINYAAMRQIPDEAGRKAFLAQEVERMRPELEKAGWTVTGVQGDRAQVSGHGYAPGWVDLVTDIEGAALPSYQTEDGADHVGPSDRGGMSFGGQGTSLVPTDTNFYNELQRRLAGILGGPAALDREELLRQLTGK